MRAAANGAFIETQTPRATAKVARHSNVECGGAHNPAVLGVGMSSYVSVGFHFDTQVQWGGSAFRRARSLRLPTDGDVVPARSPNAGIAVLNARFCSAAAVRAGKGL